MKKIDEFTMIEVMREFDFEKVQKAMKALNWTYIDTSEPSIAELKNTARTLWEGIEDWNKDEYTSTMSGGFLWVKRYGGAPLELYFVVEYVDWIGGDDA